MRNISIFIFLSFFAFTCKETPPPIQNSFSQTRLKLADRDVERLYAFYYENPTTQDEIEQNAIIDYAIQHELPMKRLGSGLYYLITDEGKGPRLEWGEELIIDYRGYFLDGKEFDNSLKRQKPLKQTLGQFVPGWNEGLRQFKTGSKGILLVPSRLAYGESGLDGLIPPNTPLGFDIHVIF